MEAKHVLALDGLRVCMFVEEGYEDLELQVPLHRLREEGCIVTVVGPAKDKEYHGKKGYPCKAERAVSSAKAHDFDALIIPGGNAPDNMRLEPGFAAFAQKMYGECKVVAAICHGPQLLCSAKILRGRRVTSYSSIKDDIENAGAIWQDSEVVIDDASKDGSGGILITSRTPQDLPAFNRAIVAELKSWKFKQGIKST